MRDSLKNVRVFAPLVAAYRSSLATGRSSAANGKYSIIVSVDISFLPATVDLHVCVSDNYRYRYRGKFVGECQIKEKSVWPPPRASFLLSTRFWNLETRPIKCLSGVPFRNQIFAYSTYSYHERERSQATKGGN